MNEKKMEIAITKSECNCKKKKSNRRKWNFVKQSSPKTRNVYSSARAGLVGGATVANCIFRPKQNFGRNTVTIRDCKKHNPYISKIARGPQELKDNVRVYFAVQET